jgi:sulfite reductase beta subunit-like hemoprotein
MATPDVPAIKRAGLPVDIARLARDGDGWLSPEERYALKTYGVCAQVQPGVFMIRCRVAGGRLTAEQAIGLADVADTHAQRWLHLSTRQNIELHHVDARAVPDVLAAVEALGLTNRSACGHTMRNVMACPDAGVGLDEPFDCGPDALAVSAALLARSHILNCALPSRMNLAFGGCRACADHAKLNDGGFESRVVDGVPGYRLWAGGSLGTMPYLGVPLVDFVRREDVVAAAEALFNTFIALGDVDNPKKGRLKFVLQAVGADGFRNTFLERFGARAALSTYRPRPVAVPDAAAIEAILGVAPLGGWGDGVRPQRTPGLAMVTVNVPLGDLDSDELRALAGLATLGDGVLYATRNQNIQYRDVAVGDVTALKTELSALGLNVSGADQAPDVRACTGSAVCSLAITAAPTDGARLLDRPGLGRNAALRVHVSGCPNSCAQHQAADIGFAGGKVRVRGETRLGYTVYVGADLARDTLAEAVGRVADEDVPAVVDGVVGAWEALRHPGETVGQTLERVGGAAFASHVKAIAEGFESEDDDELPAEPAAALGASG